MTTRRDFMSQAVTLSAALTIGAKVVAKSAGAATPPERLPINEVIVDERFAASSEVIARANTQRLPANAIQGDVTALWYHRLAPRWREQPLTLAGFTGAGALFVLERLAWEVGLRVVYRAEHWQVDERTMQHLVTGAIAMRSQAASLSRVPGQWSRTAAAVLLSGEHAAKRSASELKRSFLSKPAPATELEGISWIIAPLTKRQSLV